MECAAPNDVSVAPFRPRSGLLVFTSSGKMSRPNREASPRSSWAVALFDRHDRSAPRRGRRPVLQTANRASCLGTADAPAEHTAGAEVSRPSLLEATRIGLRLAGLETLHRAIIAAEVHVRVSGVVTQTGKCPRPSLRPQAPSHKLLRKLHWAPTLYPTPCTVAGWRTQTKETIRLSLGMMRCHYD